MAAAQVVPISEMRADGVRVMRGLFCTVFFLAAYPSFRLLAVVSALPQLDVATLRSPLLWCSVALAAAALIMARRGALRMTAPYLWIVVVAAGLAGIVGIGYLVTAVGGDWSFDALAVSGILAAGYYWFFGSPAVAAVRLLATRLPPDGARFSTVMAAPQPQPAPASTRTAPTVSGAERRSWAYGFAAVVLAISAGALIIWLAASEQGSQMVIALAVEFAMLYLVMRLWRRRRQLVADNVDEALQRDPRRLILYLRSFQDDPYLLDVEWNFLIPLRRKQLDPGLRLGSLGVLLTSGGRLEENLATVVKPIGPLVAVGAPGEQLPQLGAARAYFSGDTWQRAVSDWVDSAQLVIVVVGPSHWIRWELNTVVTRNAWHKLLIVMPPSTEQENGARWNNLLTEFEGRTWHSTLAALDPRRVVAMRLLDDGGVLVVDGAHRRIVDYVLAMRILLHHQQSVGDQSAA